MAAIVLAIDMGTSGFRGQAIDLENGGRVLATAITTRHPLPGANVMDHLHFALEIGLGTAHDVVIAAINLLIGRLAVPAEDVVRVAVCGNPIQISLFHEIEIRDLAYAGKRKLQSLGVVAPPRNAQIVKADHIRGLDLPSRTDVLIPPAVYHEVGADALAMMIQSGMLNRDEIALVTDYGTNAEMALMVKGAVYTGSTAAGPALEGQQIEDGLLALPGAICDVRCETQKIHTRILDDAMLVCAGDSVDPATGEVFTAGAVEAKGITGTGVIALIQQGMRADLIRLPRITTADAKIHLSDRIKFSEKDLIEAGKAIGAVRAGHVSLCQKAGIRLQDIQTAYMAGASGTYVDALKARDIGLIPAAVKKIHQVGNTSLSMAREMAMDVDALWRMKQVAQDLRQNHCMFATSAVFEKVYVLELSYWTEGLPWDQYQMYLNKFGLPPMPQPTSVPEISRIAARDISDLGTRGLVIIGDIGQEKLRSFNGCSGCFACVEECSENALWLSQGQQDCSVGINLSQCNGLGCSRCEKICTEKVFDLKKLLTN